MGVATEDEDGSGGVEDADRVDDGRPLVQAVALGHGHVTNEEEEIGLLLDGVLELEECEFI